MRRLALALAALALTPGAAAANETRDDYGWRSTLTSAPVVDARLDFGLRAAAAYWHRLPAGCGPLAWTAMSSAPMVAAPGPKPVMRGELGGCRLSVDPEWLEQADAIAVCEFAVHEVGHLLGLEHAEQPTAEDPVNVMTAAGRHTPEVCLGAVEFDAAGRAFRRDGATRSARSRADRRWCRRHAAKCAAKYPNLARAARITTKEAPHAK